MSEEKDKDENLNEFINIKNNEVFIKNQRSTLLGRHKITSAKLPFSKTMNEFKNKNMNIKETTGFFNKKFNLDDYKKLRENIRLKLKSPKNRPLINHKRGNGIPNNFLERMKFLEKKFNDPKFIKYYNKKPKKKSYNFNETINYFVKYSKTHSELDSIMMAFYFVCKEIKFDKDCYDSEEETKINQTPMDVYDEGLAVSSGFTNLFEYILRKMEIKFKHIDGYCKLMPKKQPIKKLKKNKKLNRVQSAKNFNEAINELNDTINHSWNAFYIKGEWYFCDCLLASGSIEKEEDEITQMNLKQLDINNNFYNYNNVNTIANSSRNNEEQDYFNFFYFMIPPDLLISTHRPIDDTWQFMPKTLSFREFYNKRTINYGEFYYNVFKYKIKLISHLYPYINITTKDKLQIKIELAGHIIEANLFYSLGNTKISEVKFLNENSSDIYTFEPVFPKKGEYILKLNARSIISTDLLYWPLLDYIIKVDNYFQVNEKAGFITSKESMSKNKRKIKEILPKLVKNLSTKKLFTPKIVSDYSKIFPLKSIKKICYDTEDFKIIEPKNFILKKGAESKFKIYIKGAVSVSILDGNRMTFLKRREDHIFIGQRVIETNNVSLCCLRGKNVFTELYKFKVINESRVLSAKPTIKKKKNRRFK